MYISNVMRLKIKTKQVKPIRINLFLQSNIRNVFIKYKS